MAFQKKTKYENIHTWVSDGKGTCFYCYDDKPVALKLIGEKGICQECLDNFKIGNLAADWHVVSKLFPGFESYSEVSDWLKSLGAELEFIGEVTEDTVAYNVINNKEAYREYLWRVAMGRSVGITGDELIELKNSFTRVEITKDGNGIRIVYHQ